MCCKIRKREVHLSASQCILRSVQTGPRFAAAPTTFLTYGDDLHCARTESDQLRRFSRPFRIFRFAGFSSVVRQRVRQATSTRPAATRLLGSRSALNAFGRPQVPFQRSEERVDALDVGDVVTGEFHDGCIGQPFAQEVDDAFQPVGGHGSLHQQDGAADVAEVIERAAGPVDLF